jgi:hypothetical protein
VFDCDLAVHYHLEKDDPAHQGMVTALQRAGPQGFATWLEVIPNDAPLRLIETDHNVADEKFDNVRVCKRKYIQHNKNMSLHKHLQCDSVCGIDLSTFAPCKECDSIM